MAWEGDLSGEEFAFLADVCNLGSGFLATNYMSFLQSTGTRGQNMGPNRLSHIYVYIWKTSMNTVLLV